MKNMNRLTKAWINLAFLVMTLVINGLDYLLFLSPDWLVDNFYFCLCDHANFHC